VILAPIDKSQDQGMQVFAIAAKYGEKAQAGGDASPDATDSPQISDCEKFLDNVQGSLSNGRKT